MFRVHELFKKDVFSVILCSVLSRLYQIKDFVSVNYPSGKKSVLVTSPSHKVICKAMVDNKSEMEKTIVDILCKTNPMAVVKGVSKLIEDECTHVCYRGSAACLQNKKFEHFQNFNWKTLYDDLLDRCPHIMAIITSTVQRQPPNIVSKPFFHVMFSSATVLHGRNQEMSVLHYMIAFFLARGGCTQRTMESLCKAGICIHPKTLHNKLAGWKDKLDEELKALKIKWTDNESSHKYQLVGDNWDKDILPSYRTTDRKTQSLHLFQMYAIVDRFSPTSPVGSNGFENNLVYIPSVQEQKQLLNELTFIFATAIIRNIPDVSKYLDNTYPQHLDHKHSKYAGIKTTQYPLGLYDTNENKTDEVIRLLKTLTDLYVPVRNEEVIDAVFFGDKLY
ncbi:uncharacterized protein LOC117338420 [Pecten maximus]|uniref:uncharacterized protein LOC117338420 n=1 Tax=Pecten maximus TaxID=6579 RepID=UPI0014583EEA|nr:uncharacterized protein LOC117338420 [Pecten maximus]